MYTSPEPRDISTSHVAALAVEVLQIVSDLMIAVADAPTTSTVNVFVVVTDVAATLKMSAMS